jgi:diguanylate cyclase (GGDEF)-like protein/PAS domain S-box-containing protein
MRHVYTPHGTVVDLRSLALPSAAELDRIMRRIFLGVRDAILVTEADPLPGEAHRILFANPAFEAMTGYAASDIVGKSPRFLQGPKTDRRILDRMNGKLAAHQGVRETIVNYRRNGSEFDVELDISPVFDREGNCTHFIAIERDVSDRTEAETLAKKTGEHVPGILYQYRLFADGRHQMPFVSSHIREIFGLTPEEVRFDGTPIFDRVHPEDRDGLRESIRSSADSLTLWFHEFRAVHPDGRVTWMRGESTPERLPDGSTVWHGYFADVTRDYEAAQEQRLTKAVFDESPLAIMVTDEVNRIVSVNPTFETMTGYLAAEVIGRNPRLLASGKQLQAFYEALWAAVQSTGSWRGEIENRRKNGEIYPEWLTISVIRDAAGKIKNHVAIFSDTTELRATEEHIERLVFFDPLTGLANRRLAEDRLSNLLTHAQRNKGLVAVIFLDLDHFKVINDTCGHKAGDDVLVEAARRLASVVRGDDVLARLGGDEFIIGLGGLDDTEGAMRAGERLIAEFAAPFEVAGRRFQVSASLGIAIFPTDAPDLPTLQQYADQAMYAAKEGGRDRFRFFSPSMHRDMLERAEREELLRLAVADLAFDLWYQPQVDLATGAIVAVEALIRARDPALGGPDKFIPLAEELGLIQTLGDFTLRQACRQARLWRDAGSPIRRVAINVSAIQFADPSLVAKIREALRAEDLPPDAIEVEITETAAMADAGRAVGILNELNDLGVEIAIDDFGTGYSSLAYLRHFPVDRIKIDRAFIAGIETDNADVELVRSVVSLARALDLDTLAEGVETEGQSTLLKALGCGMAQGYFFGRPAAPTLCGPISPSRAEACS